MYYYAPKGMPTAVDAPVGKVALSTGHDVSLTIMDADDSSTITCEYSTRSGKCASLTQDYFGNQVDL